ncbi:MAG: histidine phosphatase family protein [Bacteroidia bacterium]|jgi:probable phosphoglycerate mutase
MASMLYLLRHGQTDFNLKDWVQGSGHDTSLNATGQKQAALFYQAYANEGFDAFYCSLLQRSRQTLEPFVTDPRYQAAPLHAREGLNEFHWGDFEGRRFDEFDGVYKQLVLDWRNGRADAAPPGGESPNQVAIRMRPVVEEFHAAPYQKILACLHGRALRLLLCLLTGSPFSAMDDFDHANLCLYVLQKEGDVYRILQANRTDHLLGHQSGEARR